MEELDNKDYKQYLNLVNYFTNNIENVSYEQFVKHRNKSTNKIYVKKEGDKIIATGSLIIDYKFMHNLSCMAHIEDVVVDKEYRGKGYGKYVINELKDIARKEFKCYKVILDCHYNNIGFYEKCGFEQKQVQMSAYFEENF